MFSLCSGTCTLGKPALVSFSLPANCTENRYGAGVLTPPGSPGPYYENADCLYSLSVGEGDQIELKFTGVFDVERINGVCVDFVKVCASV